MEMCSCTETKRPDSRRSLQIFRFIESDIEVSDDKVTKTLSKKHFGLGIEFFLPCN